MAWIFRNKTPYQAGRWFSKAQLVAAAAYSLGHGGNDAQKTIGIIWLLLITAGAATSDVSTLPIWVIYSCYFAIAWGTYLGGWRIVKTMGSKITKLTPVSGSCASMGGAIEPGAGDIGRHSGVDNAHHHRCHRRCRRRTGREGRALGRDLQSGGCLGFDDSSRGPDGRVVLATRPQLPVARQTSTDCRNRPCSTTSCRNAASSSAC